jgi:hypothetical protein
VLDRRADEHYGQARSELYSGICRGKSRSVTQTNLCITKSGFLVNTGQDWVATEVLDRNLKTFFENELIFATRKNIAPENIVF